jgi:hypothetical protein
LVHCLAGVPALPLPKDATPWVLLSWGSTLLHGLDPITSVLCFSVQDDSHGISFPYNAYRQLESTSRRFTGRLAASTRRLIRHLLTVPTPPASVPLTGFLNLSATSSSCYPPVIFRQVTFMGFTLQGFDPFIQTPKAHHLRITLLPFLPSVALPQILGGAPLGEQSVP